MGGWSCNKIREIFKDRLAEFGSLLDKVNGARLRKDEEIELSKEAQKLIKERRSKKEKRLGKS